MLRDGEGGVASNNEMAGLILYAGKGFGSKECRDYGHYYRPDLKIVDALEIVCFFSFKYIVKLGYKITNDIMEARQNALNNPRL